MKEKDYCKNCPMYWCSRDYWGEYDEGCEICLDSWFDGVDYKLICKMPTFIKTIYFKHLIWKQEKYWKQQNKALIKAETKCRQRGERKND